jgi:RNA-directed DNA polymerase
MGKPAATDRRCLTSLNHAFTLDVVVCFQLRADALRVQEARRKRLGKFGLTLEPAKTKLVECGRVAQRHASRSGRRRPETMSFLGFPLYGTQNQKGHFKVGLRTEKSRLQRSLAHLRDLMRRRRHVPVREQVSHLNQVWRGHYAYDGIAGNFRAVQKVHRAVERYWRQKLCSRSRQGRIAWEVFHRIKARFPFQRPRLRLPYRVVPSMAVL